MKRVSWLSGAFLFLLSVLLGLALTLSFKSKGSSGDPTSKLRRDELLVLLKTSESLNDELKEEVKSLRASVESYQKDIFSGESSLKEIRKELDDMKIAAGLLPVIGPGVEITVKDSETPLQGMQDPSQFIVHDQDIIMLLNELKAAGAEAISIASGNTEERVVSTSFVRCTGPTIIVNQEKLTSPFKIKAIGDPEVIENSLKMRDGVVDQLKALGIVVEVKRIKKLRIEGYTGGLRFRFANPVGER